MYNSKEKSALLKFSSKIISSIKFTAYFKERGKQIQNNEGGAWILEFISAWYAQLAFPSINSQSRSLVPQYHITYFLPNFPPSGNNALFFLNRILQAELHVNKGK